jgi:hypothetical protein
LQIVYRRKQPSIDSIAKSHERARGTTRELATVTRRKASTMKTSFALINPLELDRVSGGAARVAATSSDTDTQMQLMMTQLSDSIKAVATNQNSSSSNMMLPMMMMMMGGGGGGGAAPAPAPAPAPNVVKVNVRR